MRKKLRVAIIIGVVFILAGVILALNWYFGRIISQEVEAEIEKQIKIDDEIENIDYSNLAVNPLLSSIKFEQLSIVEKETRLNIEDIELKFGLTDIINLAKQDDLSGFSAEDLNYFRVKFNNLNFADELGMQLMMENFVFEADGYYKDYRLHELNEFNLELANLDFNFNGEKDSINLKDLEILFSGYLTEQMLDEIEDIFAYDQNLDFSVAEIDISRADFFEELLFEPETANKLFNVDELVFKLDYNANDNILVIDDSKITTPIVKGELTSKYYFNETDQFKDLNSDDNFLVKAESKGNMKIEAEDLAWGDSNLTGRYSIDKIVSDSEFDSEINYDDLITILTSPSQGESEFLLEGFKVDFAGDLRQEIQNNPLLFMFGVEIDDFKIDHWSFNSKENLELLLSESKFRSPLLNTDFNFELEINNEQAEKSKVEDLEVKFSNLHPGLEMLLLEVNHSLGVSLTEDDGDIVFSRQGYLGEIIDEFSESSF